MRICVYCGSRAGEPEVFAIAAKQVGELLAASGIDLVYGGGHVGLMGIVADAVMHNGGRVYGVIPEALAQKELAHDGLTELHVVPDMHARKVKMADLSDAFVALPGGAGTMEEIFEQWTWLQLSIHNKPCGFLDVAGYYAPLLEMIENMVQHGFLSREHADMVKFSDNMDELIVHFRTFKAPEPKWAGLAGKA